VTLLPLISTPDYGFQIGETVMALGSGLIAGAGFSLWRSSATSEPKGVGWLSATGGLVVSVAAFLPVTSDDGPKFFTEMGEWMVGDRQALLVPLLLVAGWAFLLSLYPSKRVSEQRGQILAIGSLLATFFISLAIAAGTEGWGTGYGLWIALVGAGLVVAGVWRPLRQGNI
jgi:hypothetical protein